MRTRTITRPTLAELWRQILTTLESLGVEDAPAMARSLAVSGISGRPARAMGVRVERAGEVFTITSSEPIACHHIPEGRVCLRRRSKLRRRGRVPAGC